MLHQPHKFVLSGGGTGGHIFPAIAIADAIRAREPGAEILFVGSTGRMEMEKVPAAGYPIEGLWISGLQRKISTRNLLFPAKVIHSLLKARKILQSFHADVVIGTGGYASGPTLKAATYLKIPSLIQEQNSFPGITNKLLAKGVNTICVAYEGMENYFPANKIRLTGNPVRKDILSLEGKYYQAKEFFQLQAGKKTLLALGGSLGARTINECIFNGLDTLEKHNIQVIWQTGNTFYPEAAHIVSNKHLKNIKVHPFISRMDLAYCAADLIISRAGAIAISELCIAGKPVILVPSPYVTEDHQTKNARALEAKKAVLMVPDALAGELLCPTCMDLLANPESGQALGEAIRALAKPDATELIVDEVFELITKA